MDLNSSLASRIVREELTETEEGGSLAQRLQSRKPKAGSAGWLPEQHCALGQRPGPEAEDVKRQGSKERGQNRQRPFPGSWFESDMVCLHTLSQGHNWESLNLAAREKGGEGSSSRSRSASWSRQELLRTASHKTTPALGGLHGGGSQAVRPGPSQAPAMPPACVLLDEGTGWPETKCPDESQTQVTSGTDYLLSFSFGPLEQCAEIKGV